MEDEERKNRSLKILVELKYLEASHVIFNTLVLLCWTITNVFFLQDLIIEELLINPFEATLYAFNIVYLCFLIIQINRRGLHHLAKNQLDSCIEAVLLCIAVLLIYYSLRQGVSNSADHFMNYLTDHSEIKHIETRLLVVTVFPAFFCTYLILILYQCLKIFKGILDVNHQLKEGSGLTEVARAEASASEANSY